MTKDDKKQYAEGGLIGPPPGGDSVPIMLSRGCVYMSYASYKALGPGAAKTLFPNSDIEVVFTADEVRELGTKALEALQQEVAGDE